MATVSLLLVVLAATSPDAARQAKTRFGRALQVVIGVAPGFIVVLAWNHLRTGRWLHAPYPGRNTDVIWHELPLGLLGSWISPAKGLLFFTPLLCLLPLTIHRSGVARRHPRLFMLLFGSLALSMIVIASTSAWPAGGGWGLRFYVPWLPPLLMLLIAEPRVWSAPWKIAGAAAFVVGLIVNVAGLITNFQYRQQLCGQSPWSWHGANLCAVQALPDNLARSFGAHIPDTVVPAASAANVWASNRLALWWFSARSAGVSPFISWMIAGTLICTGLACWRLSASWPRQESPQDAAP